MVGGRRHLEHGGRTRGRIPSPPAAQEELTVLMKGVDGVLRGAHRGILLRRLGNHSAACRPPPPPAGGRGRPVRAPAPPTLVDRGRALGALVLAPPEGIWGERGRARSLAC